MKDIPNNESIINPIDTRESTEVKNVSEENDQLAILDIKDDEYFRGRGYSDQHMGGGTFAYEEDIMGWLFGEH